MDEVVLSEVFSHGSIVFMIAGVGRWRWVIRSRQRRCFDMPSPIAIDSGDPIANEMGKR